MTPPPPKTGKTGRAGMTARERARAELTREIKESARRQLAEVGADGLSLRAVSRELGMVSSALYRYFPSRDDLLTALIIDAYDAIGSTVEAAIAAVPAAEHPSGSGAQDAAGVARRRWMAACRAVRAWAREHPHEYALIYGSPVPGYRAPLSTIGPAARVPVALIGVLWDAASPGRAAAAQGGESQGKPETPLSGVLEQQAATAAAAIADGIGGTVPAELLVRGASAWTQLFGMVSFELFGQFANTFDPADALFEHAIAQMLDFVIQ